MELTILVYVLLIIAFARMLGEVVSRFNEPAIVGELLAGVILGPFLLGAVTDWLDEMYMSTFISDLADLGILFFMLYVGMEFSAKSLASHMREGLAIAAVSVALPFALGLFVGTAFGLEGRTLLFASVAVSVTALPVTIRVLKDLEVIETRTSGVIVSAALMTDLALLFAMATILGEDGETATFGDAALTGAGFAAFFVLAFLVGKYLAPSVYSLLKRMRTGEAAFAMAITLAIGFAILAERMGLPTFIGAFVAGLLLRETGKGLRTWARVEGILSGITLGFLAPIFFVLIGFTVDFGAVADSIWLFLSLTAIALVAKIAGSYLPARATGSGVNESLAIGSMMMGKGAMELVFAQIALEAGIIGEGLFSVLVLMAFVSTFAAPLLFKQFYNKAVVRGEVVREVGPAVGESDAMLEP
jgi:Kef-type K+ transport system membrane component KefB